MFGPYVEQVFFRICSFVARIILYLIIFCKMDTDTQTATDTLFVGNLPWAARDEHLASFFVGEYTDEQGNKVEFAPKKDENGAPMAHVVLEREMHDRSKGFGFVTFDSVEMATAALKAKQGAVLKVEVGNETQEREVRIQYRQERPARPAFRSDSRRDFRSDRRDFRRDDRAA